MKFIQSLNFILFITASSFAQNIEIHNTTGKSLDSLKASYNQKVINYTDPANNTEFIEKNKCTKLERDTSVSICSRIDSDITYKIYFSDDLSKVLQLKIDIIPQEDEIILFYQTFKNRVYDFNKEERPQRYIGISLSESIKKAIRDNELNSIDIVDMYEHSFFDPRSFSGTSLFFNIESEMNK